jgi:hypothetical protein
MSGLQNCKGAICKQASRYCICGRERFAGSHPVRGQIGGQSSFTVPPHTPSIARTVPLNSVLLSREILSMMACAFAVAQPAAALWPSGKENRAGHVQRLTPRRSSGYCARVVHHAPPQGTVLPIFFFAYRPLT